MTKKDDDEVWERLKYIEPESQPYKIRTEDVIKVMKRISKRIADAKEKEHEKK